MYFNSNLIPGSGFKPTYLKHSGSINLYYFRVLVIYLESQRDLLFIELYFYLSTIHTLSALYYLAVSIQSSQYTIPFL